MLTSTPSAPVMKNLEQYLDSGERVISRNPYSVLAGITRGGLFVVVLLLMNWMIGATFDDHSDPLGVLIFVMIVLPLAITWFGVQSVILTDRRLLFQQGILKRTVDDVPIDDIRNVAYLSAPGAPWSAIVVTPRSGEDVLISSVPDREALAGAIADNACLPLCRSDDGVTKIGTVLGAAGIYFGLFLFGVTVGDGYQAVTSLENNFTEITADHILANTLVFFVALPLTILLQFIASLLLGTVIIHACGLLILRFTISAEQLKQIVCAGCTSTGNSLYARYRRRSCYQQARYASLLYGREIRCD